MTRVRLLAVLLTLLACAGAAIVLLGERAPHAVALRFGAPVVAKAPALRIAVALAEATRRPARRAPAATNTRPLIGIGDNKADMFRDPRFRALGIKQVRYSMAWDGLSVRYERAELRNWLQAAHAAGEQVLITFDHSRSAGQSTKLPSAARFSQAFLALRHLYPWVTQFAVWNEANYCGEATCHKPTLVAAYYLALRHDCPRCTILAAELLDQPSMVPWVRQFIAAAHVQPAVWGLHNYIGANRLQRSTTDELLKAVRGDVWFTETGGLVARRNHSSIGFPENAAHAAKVTSFILDQLVALSSRIRRVYLYEWDAKTNRDSWDSALISFSGAIRESYVVLAQTLARWGVQPACKISLVPPTCTGIGGGGALGAPVPPSPTTAGAPQQASS